VTAGVLSPLLSHSDITLALGMAVPMALGWGAWTVYIHRYMKETRHA
jgi:hypothetical protein